MEPPMAPPTARITRRRLHWSRLRRQSRHKEVKEGHDVICRAGTRRLCHETIPALLGNVYRQRDPGPRGGGTATRNLFTAAAARRVLPGLDCAGAHEGHVL